MKKNKKKSYQLKRKRCLNKILGTKNVPRVSVFRSNKHIYAQLIDDINGCTICSFSTLEIPNNMNIFWKIFKKTKSYFVGRCLANILINLKIKKIVFDRGKKPYKGHIKNLAEGLKYV